jgi:hypothetical protein
LEKACTVHWFERECMEREQTTVEEGLYWNTSKRHKLIVEGKKFV